MSPSAYFSHLSSNKTLIWRGIDAAASLNWDSRARKQVRFGEKAVRLYKDYNCSVFLFVAAAKIEEMSTQERFLNGGPTVPEVATE